MNVPILIIGAGPTGLSLALWLKKAGIDFRIVDQSKGPGLASRAIAVQARTLEFYRQLGVAHRLIEAGVRADDFFLIRKGQLKATAHLGALGKDKSYFPYLLFCAQDEHEKILIDELKKLGTEIERETQLVDFTEDHDGVTATLQTSKGKETVRALYMCGCDGAHSAVRHGLNMPFAGGDYTHIFFVADVKVEKKPKNGISVSFSREDFCIIMPIKTLDSVRLIGIVPQESEQKEKITFEDVRAHAELNTGLKVTAVNWFSSYRIHHRIAEHFRSNRVFLLGDAGHIHSPAGGQGMNTGIGDSINLAWKLANVIQGRFSSKILDSYEPERRGFAVILLQTTDTAFKFIASRSFIGQMFRVFVLPGLFAFVTRFNFFLNFMFRTLSQTRIHYRDSFLSEGSAGQVQAGDRLPWVKFSNGDNYETLSARDWQIHIYGQADEKFKTMALMPVHELEWNTDAEAKGLMQNAVYVLRPDGHVVFASENQNAVMLYEYFDSLFNSRAASSPTFAKPAKNKLQDLQL